MVVDQLRAQQHLERALHGSPGLRATPVHRSHHARPVRELPAKEAITALNFIVTSCSWPR